MLKFLSPTKSKIILSLVLFLILPVTTIPMFDPSQCGLYSPAAGCVYYRWLPFGGIYFITALIFGGNQVFMVANNYVLKGGVLIIASYLLSCVVIYFIHKIFYRQTVSTK